MLIPLLVLATVAIGILMVVHKIQLQRGNPGLVGGQALFQLIDKTLATNWTPIETQPPLPIPIAPGLQIEPIVPPPSVVDEGKGKKPKTGGKSKKKTKKGEGKTKDKKTKKEKKPTPDNEDTVAPTVVTQLLQTADEATGTKTKSGKKKKTKKKSKKEPPTPTPM